MSRVRPEEATAASIVAQLEGVEAVLADHPKAPPGTHDFDLWRGNRCVGALEVTVLLDQDILELDAAIAKHGFFTHRDLSHDWYVCLTSEAFEDWDLDIGNIREQIVPLLAAFEARGVTRVQVKRNVWPPDRPFGDLPVGLAIAAEAASAQGEAMVAFLGPVHTTAVWNGNTHKTVEAALVTERLIRKSLKVGRSCRPMRILFVWLHSTLFDAYAGMALSDEAAEDAPSLPPGSTSVWVAASTGEGFVVWRSSGENWERLLLPRGDRAGSLRQVRE